MQIPIELVNSAGYTLKSRMLITGSQLFNSSQIEGDEKGVGCWPTPLPMNLKIYFSSSIPSVNSSTTFLSKETLKTLDS